MDNPALSLDENGLIAAANFERDKIENGVETVVKSNENPPAIIEKRPDIIEKPPEVIEKTPEIVEKRPDIIEKPPEVIGKPPEIIEKRPEIIEKPPEIRVTVEDGDENESKKIPIDGSIAKTTEKLNSENLANHESTKPAVIIPSEQKQVVKNK
ncbi:unnamed protein product, partial [Nesidiocoris tenuis]